MIHTHANMIKQKADSPQIKRLLELVDQLRHLNFEDENLEAILESFFQLIFEMINIDDEIKVQLIETGLMKLLIINKAILAITDNATWTKVNNVILFFFIFFSGLVCEIF